MKGATTIHKCRRKCGFVTVSNQTAQNKALSFKARGVLLYLLSLPDDWIVSLEHVAKQNPQGVKAVASAAEELRKAGYMRREPIRNSEGRLQGTRWLVFDEPQPVTETPKTAVSVNATEEHPFRSLDVFGASAKGQTTKKLANKETEEERKKNSSILSGVLVIQPEEIKQSASVNIRERTASDEYTIVPTSKTRLRQLAAIREETRREWGVA